MACPASVGMTLAHPLFYCLSQFVNKIRFVIAAHPMAYAPDQGDGLGRSYTATALIPKEFCIKNALFHLGDGIVRLVAQKLYYCI